MNRLKSCISNRFEIVRGAIALSLLLPTSVALAAPLSLTNWTVVQYTSGGVGDSEWVLQPGDTSVLQTRNSNASILLSDFTIDHSATQGFRTTVSVDSQDDDQIGFVFGYQDSSNYYLFQWRAGNAGVADDGMHIRRITAVGEPTQADLEGPQPTGTGTGSMFMLEQNNLQWSPNVVYQLTVLFTATGFDLTVSQGATELESWSIDDLTFVAGNVGLYNSSQPNVLYSATLDVDVVDTDGDGTMDSADNCTLVPNGPVTPDAGGNIQLDTNGDGIGNACDPDLNNDNVVDFGDLPAVQAAFFSTPTSGNWNPDADTNGDQVVDFGDLPTYQAFFFGVPGPAGTLP